ncbi:NAD(P)/FAD-dependent oxidoreductase [Actinomycetospora sp. NBRC 106378]|uniref:phytoene desaturase family protein n=1 Tax=Actinomycetospora sp. NBRC 106378 TaxID=3032208 RepID=UPI0024A29B67|nr:NAD(P)/FAD-dependent oxidoreductase [Actinomycetospora sp. NBRC 106378]GLZ55728.1 FAD-dependent oxidoreductase [Actinomycetospora sp. NBRC 106378]
MSAAYTAPGPSGAGDRVDAVVVGAGHNGLVAANLLADAGWEVLVLEATDTPGGATRSADLAAPGWRTDLGSAFHPLGAASPVLRGLELERYGLRWSHAPQPLAHVLPDDRAAVISRDLDATASGLDAFAPGDGDAWRRLAAQWQQLRDPLLGALLGPFPPVRGGLRLLRATGSPDLLRLVRRLLLPALRFGVEEFRGEGARALVAGNAMHADVPPTGSGSTAFGWLLSMLAQDVGFPVPVGGSGSLAAALVARLEARGGRVETGRPVAEVLVERGVAVGVADGAGGSVRARRAVLADVPAPVLYRDLVGCGHLPSRLRADLDRFQWDHAVLKVDWALSGPVPWTARGARDAGTVHVGADTTGLVDLGADLAAGRVPEAPYLILGQLTTADPTRSPCGTESLWSYTRVPHDALRGPGEVDAHVARMEAVLARHAPGFADLVVGRAVSGPDELQHQNPGLVRGALMAGTASPHQQLVFRPTPGLGRPDTVIDRLFLSGASAHPGGAVHGGPGAAAARAALARGGRLGPAYAAAIRAGHRVVHGSG